jgi:hypothetical protein
MAKKRDPIGPWFVAAEELGEYIGIRFGRIPPGGPDEQPEWIFLRHTGTDGIGGFAKILRQRGASLDRLPQIKHPSQPSRLAFLQLLPKFLKPRQRVYLRRLAGEKTSSTKQNPPTSVAWHAFDESATTQIRRVCRKSGVTINSFLLKHLTKAIRPSLQDESSVVPWMVPVNVRGKVTLGCDTDNHTSYVGVHVRSYETVDDVHRNIYDALGRGEHWANWQGYKLGLFINGGLRRFLIKKELAMSQWNLGGFSNLGDWDPEKKITQPECQGAWLFAPPVLRCQLLGAGCVTFQNRLSLTLQIHPELTVEPKVAQDWVQSWVKEIEMDVASVLPESATT